TTSSSETSSSTQYGTSCGALIGSLPFAMPSLRRPSFDHLAAQQELGERTRTDEAEQRDQQRHLEVHLAGVPQADDQDRQHAVDVEIVERLDAVLGGRTLEQPHERQDHADDVAGQGKENGPGEGIAHSKIS